MTVEKGRYITVDSGFILRVKNVYLFYAFFCVIPRYMNFIFQRFRTFCPTFIGG
jgi:hypothetical protein